MGLLSALWSCSDLAASPDRISPSVKPLSSLSAPKLAPSNSPLFLSRCERTVESLRGRTHVEKATRKQISLSLSVCLSLSLSLSSFLPSAGVELPGSPRQGAPFPLLRWQRHRGLKNWAVSPVRYGRQRPSGREPPPLYTNQTTGLVPALSTARSLVPASDDTPCGLKGLRALPLLHGITTNS